MAVSRSQGAGGDTLQPVPCRVDGDALVVTLGDLLASAAADDIRVALAANPACPYHLQAFLAVDAAEDVRCAVARNPRAPLALLSAMADFDGGIPVGILAADPVLVPVLAAREGILGTVGLAIARNPSLPAAVLAGLASLEAGSIQMAVADNPATDRQVIKRLASAESWRVRRHLAGKPDLPVGLLDQLSWDEDDGVRRAVAWNPSTSRVTRDRLARDAVFVVRAAARGDSQPGDLPSRLEHVWRRMMARWSSAAPSAVAPTESGEPVELGVISGRESLLERFEGLNDDEMRQAATRIAGDPQADLGMRIGRLDDPVALPGVVIGASATMVAARHPLTPPEVLATLMADPDFRVRREAVARLAPACVDAALLERMADDDSPQVRAVLAGCAPASMPERLWRDLASDVSVDVARAVERNPQAHPLARALLALRPDRE